MEIKGNSVDLSPQLAQLQGYEIQFVPGQTAGARGLTFADVLTNPSLAREEFLRWKQVVLRTSNSRTASGLYLGKYDRRALPDSPRIELTFWQDEAGLLCKSFSSIPGTSTDCQRFNSLAREGRGVDRDGLIVVEFPNEKPARTTYIIPLADRQSATGEAIYFQCAGISRSCRNSDLHVYGYAIRRNVSLYYEFQEAEYPRERLRELDLNMQTLFDDVVLKK